MIALFLLLKFILIFIYCVFDYIKCKTFQWPNIISSSLNLNEFIHITLDIIIVSLWRRFQFVSFFKIMCSVWYLRVCDIVTLSKKFFFCSCRITQWSILKNSQRTFLTMNVVITYHMHQHLVMVYCIRHLKKKVSLLEIIEIRLKFVRINVVYGTTNQSDE